jgi:CheY-like chemotaxis protein
VLIVRDEKAHVTPSVPLQLYSRRVETSSSSLPPPRILIVDDDERARQVARDSFADRGCEVVTVADSDEAVRELRSSPGVHLLFTDVRLSDRENDDSGMQLGDYVKKIRPDVPVVVYSTHFYENELDAALDTSARERFDVVLPRGGPSWDDDATFRRCVDLAARYRDQRSAHGTANASGTGPEVTIAVMRELIVRQFSSDAAGARGAVPEPTTLKLLDVSFGELRGSIAVWVLEHGASVSVELYQRPEFHAAAVSLDAALGGLARLLHSHLDVVQHELTRARPEWDSIPFLLMQHVDEWDRMSADDAS